MKIHSVYGIVFLEESVVYIGISQDVKKRFRAHMSWRSPCAQWIKDNYSSASLWIFGAYADRKTALQVEADLIRRNKPPLNRKLALNPGTWRMPANPTRRYPNGRRIGLHALAAVVE